MKRVSLQEIIRDPDRITESFLHRGKTFRFRIFRREDAEKLGSYFEGLSEATRRLYAPHAFTREEARRLCETLDYGQIMRFIVELDSDAADDHAHGHGDEKRDIVAYAILGMGFLKHDEAHYMSYGFDLDNSLVCTLAPSVGDAWQNNGLGSAMIDKIIAVARQLGMRWIVLWGGTQARNRRAIHFYEKFGFRKVGEFESKSNEETIDNHDMILEL